MIIAKLQGGLGNQMFQYAAARGIKGKSVLLDHSFLDLYHSDNEGFTARKYELGIFKKLKARKADCGQVKSFLAPDQLDKIVGKIFKKHVIRQTGNELFQNGYLASFHHLYLDGYFQSEKYFKHIRSQLLTEFAFPELDAQNQQLKKKIAETPNALSIHIRRGDYVKSKITLDLHGVLPVNFYEKAIEKIKETCTDIGLFVFSDDMEWTKQNFANTGLNTIYIEHNKNEHSWKDMALMSNCKHHIIANSSFSWWGAWLSEKGGEVFAPDRWFNPKKIEFNIHDFIPERWHILNV